MKPKKPKDFFQFASTVMTKEETKQARVKTDNMIFKLKLAELRKNMVSNNLN